MAEDGTRQSKSFVNGLKTEWSLFWESIVGDDEVISVSEQEKDPFLTGRIGQLSLDKIKVITKALSQDRKRLNQRLESLNKELDLNAAKLDSLRLIGAEAADTECKINELSDLGQAVSDQLAKIDERLKLARRREKELREGPELHGN
jgi:chromosome segregation ATPase